MALRSEKKEGIAGLVTVAASSRMIESLLYGVRPNDPVTTLLAVAALALVSAAATWIPARGVSSLDPYGSSARTIVHRFDKYRLDDRSLTLAAPF